MIKVYGFAFIAVLAMLILPSQALASCEYMACDSYGYYDEGSNEAFGYSWEMDYVYWWNVAVEAHLSAPGEGHTPLQGYGWSGWHFFEAEADTYDVPSDVGVYSILADNYSSTEPDYWYYREGQTSAEFNALYSVNSTNLAGQTWHSGNTYPAVFYGNLLKGLTPSVSGCDGQYSMEPSGWTWDGSGQLTANVTVNAAVACELDFGLDWVQGYAMLEPPPPQPPTISTGNAGIWYLGSATVNDNCAADGVCYYNNTVVTMTPGAGGNWGSGPASWTVTDPLTGNPSSFANYTCNDDDCSSITVQLTAQPSYCSSGGNIRVQGTLGGLTSNSLTLASDWPQWVNLVAATDIAIAAPVGYLSVNTLQLVSGCHQNMFRIAFHEEFPTDGGGSAAPFHACNGSHSWTDAIDKASWAPGTTDDDGILTPDDPQASFDGIAYTNGGSPSPSPPVTKPGPSQNPPQALNMNAQAYSSLFIFVGSQDTANLGKYWPAEPLMQVRYTDHGRDEPGSWRCPAP